MLRRHPERLRRRMNTCSIRPCWVPGELDTPAPGGPDLIERLQAYRHQGGARGQGANQLARSRRRLRGRSRAIHPASAGPQPIRAVHRFVRRLRATGSLDGRAQQPEPGDPQGHDAGRARLLSRHRALGPVAGRSRQPAPGRFRRTGASPAITEREPSIGPPWPRLGPTAGSSSP